MNNVKMPDITLAQVLAAVAFLVGQAVAWGWVDNDTGQWVISLASTILSAGWQVADSIIRHGRSKVVAAAVAQGASVRSTRV